MSTKDLGLIVVFFKYRTLTLFHPIKQAASCSIYVKKAFFMFLSFIKAVFSGRISSFTILPPSYWNRQFKYFFAVYK